MCLWLHCIYRCIWKSQACFCKCSYFLTCWEETQLLLQLCLHTPTCWNAKTNANSSLWVVLFLSGLFSFAPFNLKKKCLPYFSLVHSLFIRLSSCLSPRCCTTLSAIQWGSPELWDPASGSFWIPLCEWGPNFVSSSLTSSCPQSSSSHSPTTTSQVLLPHRLFPYPKLASPWMPQGWT